MWRAANAEIGSGSCRGAEVGDVAGGGSWLSTWRLGQCKAVGDGCSFPSAALRLEVVLTWFQIILLTSLITCVWQSVSIAVSCVWI